ncbi:pimeloyl-CoA dehydrogenase small subunit [Massilia sp. CCM 8733]|uniref:Pimeloyl-CoA dehydrogenase small subunit n=1 Tax=Massilia mucilaginosa TaxID=2609282 RepID=A0ABX0NZZ1_9BURK|nr:acyl-CoA dehydrogenase family protein [Massilia mucilaginosa]NHZ92586.1 pimeloyl-CoA dehydrogenase small subunit [Massilia mucilaginosa]
MDFNFKEEQLAFADALKRWVTKDYSFEARKKIVHSEAGSSDAAWAALAELGMLALPVPEEQGGFNGTAVDMFVVMQELGRGLVVEPYFATVLGAHFLTLGGQHPELLAQVAGGELKLACALAEKQARHDLSDIATTAVANAGGYVLNGRKSVVVHGGQAGSLIVSARSGGAQRGFDGVSLFVVPANAPGVSVRDYRTLDGQRAADIGFANVQVARENLIGLEGQGWNLLDAGADYGAGLLCAEALGAMEAIFAATLDYLKTRTQFGAPIGKFQALQHRMADMYIHLEQARSMALLAAVRLASSDVEERRRTVSAAKFRVGQALKFVGQQAVQLHGGMGVTDELPAAHHFKRLTMIELSLGDSDHHLQRFIAQPGFAQGDMA